MVERVLFEVARNVSLNHGSVGNDSIERHSGDSN